MTERRRDVAHIGRAQLLTPAAEASLEYFTALLGLTVVAEDNGRGTCAGTAATSPTA
jgi:hypothetical protein